MTDQLIRRVAIQAGGTWLHLPPFRGVFQATPRVESQTANRRWNTTEREVVQASRIVGHDLLIAGQFHEAAVTNALALQAAIRGALFDSGKVARLVEACEWRDDSGTYAAIWRKCRCVGMSPFEPEVSVRWSQFELRLQTGTLAPYTTASDGSVGPDAGPYENYI